MVGGSAYSQTKRLHRPGLLAVACPQSMCCMISASLLSTTNMESSSRIAVHSGIPPPSFSHFDDSQCRASLEAPFWNDLVTSYDISMFLNRMHAAMAAQLSSQRQVPNTMIAPWEQEFETLRPTIIQANTGTLPSQLKKQYPDQ